MKKKILFLFLLITVFAVGCDYKNPVSDLNQKKKNKVSYTVLKKAKPLLTMKEASVLKVEHDKSATKMCLIFDTLAKLTNWKNDYSSGKSAGKSLALNAGLPTEADSFLLSNLDKTIKIGENINLCNIHQNPQINTWKLELDNKIVFYTAFEDRLNTLSLDIEQDNIPVKDDKGGVVQYCGPHGKNSQEFIWSCGKDHKTEIHVNRRTGEMVLIKFE